MSVRGDSDIQGAMSIHLHDIHADPFARISHRDRKRGFCHAVAGLEGQCVETGGREGRGEFVQHGGAHRVAANAGDAQPAKIQVLLPRGALCREPIVVSDS